MRLRLLFLQAFAGLQAAYGWLLQHLSPSNPFETISDAATLHDVSQIVIRSSSTRLALQVGKYCTECIILGVKMDQSLA